MAYTSPSSHRPRRNVVGNFTIVQPAAEESVPLNADGTINVVVDDLDNHDAVVAAVCKIRTPPPPPIPTFDDCALLTKNGNSWTGDIAAGALDSFDILEDHKQIVVYGRKNGVDTTLDNPFRISRAAAALTCGTTSAQHICTNCSTSQALPVCVQMTLAGLSNDDPDLCHNCVNLNGTVRLQHSNDPCFCCCWFSGPVNFCDNVAGAGPGYWKLQKMNARTWNLKLLISQPNAPFPRDVILYTFDTAADNDCSLPIILTKGAISMDACDNFPANITVSVV